MVTYKVFIDSAHIECLPNLIGCSKIYHYLRENEHIITNNPSQADFIIINTCGVFKELVKHTLDIFHKMYSLKKNNAKIIMFGCLVKIDNKLIDTLDSYSIDFDQNCELDKIFYNKTKFETITPYCDDLTKNKFYNRIKPPNFWKIAPFIISRFFLYFSKELKKNYQHLMEQITYSKKNFVEISRGCSGNCSYCTIKKTKGNICSRSIDEIMSDIEKNYDPSKTLFLVADDCASYGTDIKSNLIDLIYKINKKFPELVIDLNYLNPTWLEKYSDHFIKLFKNVRIGLVIIPMQSGSNKIIKKMNRHYNINNVIKIIDQIKKISPKTILYSHYIVGFPGENTIDFLKTISTLKYFHYPTVFKYSEMKHTYSAAFKNKKSFSTKLIRYIIFIIIINFIILYNLKKYNDMV